MKSLGITLSISFGISLALTLVGISFWASFLIITLLQIIGWQLFQYVVSVSAALKNKQIEEQMMKEYMSNSAIVPCAACKQENLAPIQLDITNSFKCTNQKCKVENVIYVHIETAQITTPLKSLKLEDTIKINDLK